MQSTQIALCRLSLKSYIFKIKSYCMRFVWKCKHGASREVGLTLGSNLTWAWECGIDAFSTVFAFCCMNIGSLQCWQSRNWIPLCWYISSSVIYFSLTFLFYFIKVRLVSMNAFCREGHVLMFHLPAQSLCHFRDCTRISVTSSLRFRLPLPHQSGLKLIVILAVSLPAGPSWNVQNIIIISHQRADHSVLFLVLSNRFNKTFNGSSTRSSTFITTEGHKTKKNPISFLKSGYLTDNKTRSQ